MNESIKLTSYSHGAGCACKLGSKDLSEVLRLLGPVGDDDSVLVGLDEADDAAIVRLSDDVSLVLTIDFFTPLVDDAYTWGRIAAANAASDVYAMGGVPLFALNVTAWPRETLPLELLADVLRGGLDIAKQAGMAIVGGHTIDDPEPKYGLCVIGRADPAHTMTIDAAEPGDVLVLSKPIGTGVVTTAIKRDAAPQHAVDAAVASMTHLNASASRTLVANGVRASTDVTGFGLLGHLRRMLSASGVAAEIDAVSVPLLPDVRSIAEAGAVAGGTRRNIDALDDWVDWGGADELTRVLLADAQTSGGLLAAVPPDRVERVLAGLDGEPAAAIIGRVVGGAAGRITVAS